MMSVAMIDNDMGDFEIARKAISKLCPSVSVECALGAWMAEQRIEFFAEADFDISVGLFVVEAKLNDGDPIKLIRLIKGSEKLKNIPVVIYTNTDDEAARKACLDAGGMKVISKGPGVRGADTLALYVASLQTKS